VSQSHLRRICLGSWLRDESLEESDNLPDPGALAQEIAEDLEATLEQFREIEEDVREGKDT
jgi:type I restriction enzyme M protein